MGKTAFLCSGQGAQAVGMGVDFADVSPEIADLFETAKECSGLDVFSLCANGPIEELSLTQNTQPCLVTTSLAIAMAVRQKGIEPDCVAGFSLGEYAAHVIANTTDVETALQLVSRRGALMAMAANQNKGGMAALLRCTPEQAQELCASVAQATGQVIVPANYNCPGQVVISGADEALDAAIEKWKEEGGRCTKLATSGAFHSPLMQNAAAGMAPALKGSVFGPGEIPLYCNYTARPYEASQVDELLTKQITSPVRWEETIRNMIENGVDRFVECGPGKVLSGMVKRIAKDAGAAVEIISVGTREDWEAL